MKAEKIEIGSNIYGVDIKSLKDGELEALKDHLYKNRIIVLKNQDINEKEYCEFAVKFGFPVPYLQSHYNHPEFPLIFISSNIKANGKQMGVARTGGYWHSDTAFEQNPKTLTMLLPKVLPHTSKRTTRFIDMSAVYNALPKEITDKLEGRSFNHSGRWRYKIRTEDAGIDIAEILELIDYYQPPVAHPAVVVHPVTGEKIIYGSRGFTIGIDDKINDESNHILKTIFDFAETEQFIKEVTWSMGDLIIWDNRFLVHSSGRAKAPTDNIHEEVKKEEETMMYRITMEDGHPLCASLLPTAVAV